MIHELLENLSLGKSISKAKAGSAAQKSRYQAKIRMAIVAGAVTSIAETALAQEQSPARVGLPPSPVVADILGHASTELRNLSASELVATRNQLNARLQHLQIELSRSREAQPEAIQPPGTPRPRPQSEITTDIATTKFAQEAFDNETICGPVDRSQDVERYDGTLGPTIDFVARYRGPTGQIQWNDIPDSAFPADAPSNQFVKNVKWCTGTLIRNDMFLTAAHCLAPQTGLHGWFTPVHQVKGGATPYTPTELAPLMHINFNYEIDVATGYPRVPDVYPVLRLLEYQGPIGRSGSIDYAILQLGTGANGTPSQHYGNMQYDVSKVSLSNATVLTVIQHPSGNPKRVAAGNKIRVSTDLQQLFYGDVDTLDGSSGSGVIDQRGRLIGVHTDGGCTATKGENSGYSLVAISHVSRIIH
jgi:hypothetical protein